MKISKSLFVVALSFFLLGCNTSSEDSEALTGQAVSGISSHHFNPEYHRNHVAAHAGGTIVGGVHPRHVGRSMEHSDRMKLYHALEMNASETWINPRNGYRYIAEPVRTYHRGHYQYCREYVTRVFIGHRWESIHGTACRTPGGHWRNQP